MCSSLSHMKPLNGCLWMKTWNYYFPEHFFGGQAPTIRKIYYNFPRSSYYRILILQMGKPTPLIAQFTQPESSWARIWTRAVWVQRLSLDRYTMQVRMWMEKAVRTFKNIHWQSSTNGDRLQSSYGHFIWGSPSLFPHSCHSQVHWDHGFLHLEKPAASRNCRPSVCIRGETWSWNSHLLCLFHHLFRSLRTKGLCTD